MCDKFLHESLLDIIFKYGVHVPVLHLFKSFLLEKYEIVNLYNEMTGYKYWDCIGRSTGSNSYNK